MTGKAGTLMGTISVGKLLRIAAIDAIVIGLGEALFDMPDGGTTLWISTGVGIWFLSRCEPRERWWVFSVLVAVAVGSGALQDTQSPLSAGLGSAAEISLGARWLRGLLAFDQPGTVLRAFGWGIGAAAIGGAVAGLADPGYGTPMSVEMLAHMIGFAVAFPLFVCWTTRNAARARPREIVTSFAVVTVALLGMFEQSSTNRELVSELSQYAILAVLLLAAVRLGPFWLSMLGAMAAVFASNFTVQGNGPYHDAGITMVGAVVTFQVAITMFIVALHVLASYVVLHRRMETEFKTTTDELTHRTEELERRNDELNDFAYIASHELQEPLRMVSGYLQLLEDRYRARLGADADEFIGYAVGGSKRLQDLVHDLLDYSQSAGSEPTSRTTELNRVVDDALSVVRQTVEGKAAFITRDDLPAILCDPRLLREVFVNLIANAVTFHDESRAHVRITAEHYAGVIVVSVADDGIGIPKEQRKQVFQPFHRLHARERYPGTGLGLAVCERIVRAHGGRIWVEGVLGGGSRLRFSLPICSAASNGHGAQSNGLGSHENGRVELPARTLGEAIGVSAA